MRYGLGKGLGLKDQQGAGVNASFGHYHYRISAGCNQVARETIFCVIATSHFLYLIAFNIIDTNFYICRPRERYTDSEIAVS